MMLSSAQTVLPRWRGFNLLDFFTTRSSGEVSEDDFRWIAGWGFNFVRLPMCYTLWMDPREPEQFFPPMLEKIDRALELAQQYSIHLCLNFHRAPGYCVNPELQEPYSLWKDEEAVRAFCRHWQMFADRYRETPSDLLSFNLVNEPSAPGNEVMTREEHARAIRAAVRAIRETDAARLIIADGVSWGNDPCPELAELGIAQSCRAYLPMGISHYQAHWIDSEAFPAPAWPGGWHYGEIWDRRRLEQHYGRWAQLARQGVGVHCGEGGAFNRTPHAVTLRWLRDVLDILRKLNIGIALWNFRGAFGILDSERQDVAYEAWHGHKLDREMLSLLQEF